MIRRHIEKMSFDLREISDMAATIPQCIRADIGALNYPVDPILRQLLLQKVNDDRFEYTSTMGSPDLIAALREFDSVQAACYKNPTFLVTSGGQAALFSILVACMDKGDTILTDYAFYPPYKSMAEVLQLEIQTTVFQQIGRLPGDVSKVRALIINHPNNPTGEVYTENQLRHLATLAEANDWLVIEDRVYDRISFEESVPSIAKLIPNRTISVHSASKNLCVPGMRIGWMLGEEKLVRQIAKVHRNMNSSPNSLSQHALAAYLPQSDEFFTGLRDEMENRRNLLANVLDQLNWEYRLPQGAIYMFPRIPHIVDSRPLVFDLIKNAGISTIPGDCFGAANRTGIRICYGAMKETDIEQFGQRLMAFFE